MGIRFACHVCQKPLNIKRELGGRRGICPACAARIRIPTHDTAYSSPADSDPQAGAGQVSTAAAMSSQPASSQMASQPASPVPAQPAPVSDQPAAVPSQPAVQRALAEVLPDDPEAVWYVRPPSGGQYGPASSAVLEQWIDEGRVAASALLWRDGWPQWREATEVLPQLAGQLPGAADAGHAGVGDAGFVQPAASPAPVDTPDPHGEASVGTVRRNRSLQRVLLISLLSVLALLLVGVLWYVLSHGPEAV